MRKRSRFRLWLGIAVTAGLLALLLWKFWPRERLLLNEATFIAKTDQWYQHEDASIGLHWLSDTELLVDRFEGKAEHRIIYRHNILTGQDTKLSRLSTLLDSVSVEHLGDVEVSPNGKWFVCSNRTRTLIAEVQGAQYHIYRYEDFGEGTTIYWMADNQHWLEYYDTASIPQLVLHDTHDLKSSQILPVGINKELFSALQNVQSLQKAVSIVQQDWNTYRKSNDPNPHMNVYSFALNDNSPNKTHYDVTFPRSNGEYEITVSPHGDKIALQKTTHETNRIAVWIQHIFPAFRARHWQQTEISVCNMDGSDMHSLGSFSFR